MRATKLLMEEHELILRGLGLLEKAAARGSAPDALLDFLTGFADAHHHGKEEQILFPALVEAGFPSEAGPVGVMLHEHVEGRKLIAALRDPKQFAAAARGYVDLLRSHIAKENQVLFPMADRAVEDQRAVDAAFDDFEAQWAARRRQHEAALEKLGKELA